MSEKLLNNLSRSLATRCKQNFEKNTKIKFLPGRPNMPKEFSKNFLGHKLHDAKGILKNIHF